MTPFLFSNYFEKFSTL